jgi:hypothetical protein
MFPYQSRTMKIILTTPLLNKELLYTVFLAHNMAQDILFFILVTTRQTFHVSCVHVLDYGEIKCRKLRLHP